MKTIQILLALTCLSLLTACGDLSSTTGQNDVVTAPEYASAIACQNDRNHPTSETTQVTTACEKNLVHPSETP